MLEWTNGANQNVMENVELVADAQKSQIFESILVYMALNSEI